MKLKLTKDTVAALTLPAGKTDHIEWDIDLRGFGIRVRRDADGKVRKTGIVQWKRGGRSRRMNVGSVDLTSPAELREIARGILGRVANGEDPQAERREQREKDALTLRTQVTEFLEAKKPDWAPATYGEVKRYLTDPKYLGPLHHRPLNAIALANVSACIVAIKREYGDATAGRARSALANFFVWAMRMGLAAANPCIGSINPKANKRDRVLTGAELVAVWKACGDDDYGCIVKLLICTGCRRAEIGDMRFSELNFERGTFTIPKERAKTDTARVIPLLPMVREIIDGVPRMASRDWLFGERAPDRGFTGWQNAKTALDQRSGVKEPPWVVHDLRRSVATHMAEELKIQPHIVELVLGHEFRVGVRSVYNRAPYPNEIRDAYLRWHDYLRALIEGGERKIIAFPQSVSTS
jgi:integrase